MAKRLYVAQILAVIVVCVTFATILWLLVTTKKGVGESYNSRVRTMQQQRFRPGTFQCNKYRNEEVHGRYFAMCRFENICLNKKGQFVLTKEKDSFFNDEWFDTFNGKAWLYAQGNFKTNRGFVPIHLKDGILEYEYNTNNLFLNRKGGKSKVETSKDFKYVQGSSFALYRFAAGNAGHILSENMAMTIAQMLSFDDVTLDNNIIFLEDTHDTSKPDWVLASYGYLPTVDKFSIEWFSLISNNPVQQLCHDENGYKVVNAPCRNVASAVESDEFIVCYERLYMGHSVSNLEEPYGREVMNPTFRNLIYDKLKLPHQRDLKKKKFTVVIQRKKLSSPHGMIISNVDEIAEYLRENVPNDPIFKQSGKELEILPIQLEDFTTVEQIKLLHDLDVYLTTHGSGAYLSYVISDKSLVIQSPHCSVNNGTKFCYQNEATSTYANVQLMNYLYLLPPGVEADCTPRPLKHNPNNCDPILDHKLMYRAVLGHFKSIYASEIYQ
ncbi:hypothetical protein ABK040_002473 [Willaertia magna]